MTPDWRPQTHSTLERFSSTQQQLQIPINTVIKMFCFSVRDFLSLSLLFVVSFALSEDVFFTDKNAEEEENNTVEVELNIPQINIIHHPNLAEIAKSIPETSPDDQKGSEHMRRRRPNEMFRSFVEEPVDQQDKPRLHDLPVEHFEPGEGKMESSAEAKSILFRGSGQGLYIPLTVKDLLPDQCHKRPFDQVVSHPGCENSIIRGYMCYGLCSSLFVPSQTDLVQSCTCCLPVETHSVAVDLHCPGGDSVRKHVKVVKACSCLPCTSSGVYR